MNKKYKMHVISGTHWDREWRHTAEQSKPRLVELIDRTMEVLENDQSYRTFCLDGGTVVIEDYLSIRPENEGRLRKLIQDNRLQLVSWYTLPETFTVAPESLIRNLLLGKKMSEEYGGAIASGYTATSYGQTSQLPQIYRGFGINSAIFYRGTNKYLLKPLFLWEGIDGSTLYTLRTFDEVTRTNWFFYVHQPLVLGKSARSTYHIYRSQEVPAHMCDRHHYERPLRLLNEERTYRKDADSLNEALELIQNQARPYAIGRHLLALNMEDNDTPFELLPEMIEKLNDVSEDVELVQDDLDSYMNTIISEAKKSELPVHRGELRKPGVEPGFNGLLGATHSSRIKLKILNERAETALLYQTEPLASFLYLLGAEYPAAILNRAWRHLLQNHAHDSICGAAVDRAHEDMLYNFSVAQTVSEEITSRSILGLYNLINTADYFDNDDHLITLFNTLPFDRRGVVELVVDLPKFGAEGAVIDPCSGIGEESQEIDFFDFVDEDGNQLDYEVLSKEKIQIAVDRELDTKGIKMNAVRRRILLDTEIPSMGYATVALRPRAPRYVPNPQHGPDRKLIARESGIVENEYLKVTIKPNGTFDLLHKQTGHLMPGQHYFTDNGEVGSAHLLSSPQRNPVITSRGCHASIVMVETNTLRGVYRIDVEFSIPAGATNDGKDRLRETKSIAITTFLTLEKGCPFLRIKSRLNNEACDHRIRVNFPSHIKSRYACVESAFAVENRQINWNLTGDNFEGFYAYGPMQNFVDISSDKLGLAVLNQGLREYEVMDDNERTIAITLLRTHRAYMTANCDMTPEELDKYTGSHSFGRHEYYYALYPHCDNWDTGQVLRRAYEHKVDIAAVQSVPCALGQLLPTNSFIKIEPAEKIMLSALKQAADGKGTILRLWNTGSKQFSAVVSTTLPIKSAELVNLDESHIAKLSTANGRINIEFGPHKIVTLKLKTE